MLGRSGAKKMIWIQQAFTPAINQGKQVFYGAAWAIFWAYKKESPISVNGCHAIPFILMNILTTDSSKKIFCFMS